MPLSTMPPVQLLYVQRINYIVYFVICQTPKVTLLYQQCLYTVRYSPPYILLIQSNVPSLNITVIVELVDSVVASAVVAVLLSLT